MIQTELKTDEKIKSSLGAPNAVVPALTRTRCPGCQKLFAVETEVLNSMSAAGVIRAEFTCTGELCHEAFGIDLPLSHDLMTLAIIPSVRLTKIVEKTQPKTPKPAQLAVAAVEAPLRERVEAPLRAGTEAPLRAGTEAPLQAKIQAPAVAKSATSVRTKSTVISERECPRCSAMNAATMNECVRCGIIFDRYIEANEAQLEEELALGGTRELSLLWDKTLEDYEDRIRHDRFLNACRDANALSYASKKYSQILIAAPQDDIARLMRNRIVAMISMRAESSRFPIRLSFRIPKINSMALFGGSVLFVWGVAMPQMKNMMEIGLSLILLAIGVRLALRARI